MKKLLILGIVLLFLVSCAPEQSIDEIERFAPGDEPIPLESFFENGQNNILDSIDDALKKEGKELIRDKEAGTFVIRETEGEFRFETEVNTIDDIKEQMDQPENLALDNQGIEKELFADEGFEDDLNVEESAEVPAGDNLVTNPESLSAEVRALIEVSGGDLTQVRQSGEILTFQTGDGKTITIDPLGVSTSEGESFNSVDEAINKLGFTSNEASGELTEAQKRLLELAQEKQKEASESPENDGLPDTPGAPDPNKIDGETTTASGKDEVSEGGVDQSPDAVAPDEEPKKDPVEIFPGFLNALSGVAKEVAENNIISIMFTPDASDVSTKDVEKLPNVKKVEKFENGMIITMKDDTIVTIPPDATGETIIREVGKVQPDAKTEATPKEETEKAPQEQGKLPVPVIKTDKPVSGEEKTAEKEKTTPLAEGNIQLANGAQFDPKTGEVILKGGQAFKASDILASEIMAAKEGGYADKLNVDPGSAGKTGTTPAGAPSKGQTKASSEIKSCTTSGSSTICTLKDGTTVLASRSRQATISTLRSEAFKGANAQLITVREVYNPEKGFSLDKMVLSQDVTKEVTKQQALAPGKHLGAHIKKQESEGWVKSGVDKNGNVLMEKKVDEVIGMVSGTMTFDGLSWKLEDIEKLPEGAREAFIQFRKQTNHQHYKSSFQAGRGWSKLSSLFCGDEGCFGDLAQQIDKAFHDAYLGSEYWTEAICKQATDVTEDTENIIISKNRDGTLFNSAFITGTKQFVHSGDQASMLYRISFEIQNPEKKRTGGSSFSGGGSGLVSRGLNRATGSRGLDRDEREVFNVIKDTARDIDNTRARNSVTSTNEDYTFNVLFKGNREVFLFREDQIVEAGDVVGFSREDSLVGYIPEDFERVCIVFFGDKPLDAFYEEIDEICATIEEVGLDGPVAIDTGEDFGFPGFGDAGFDVPEDSPFNLPFNI